MPVDCTNAFTTITARSLHQRLGQSGPETVLWIKASTNEPPRCQRSDHGKTRLYGMTIVLNHTIIAATDKQVSATFFSQLFGLAGPEQSGPFAAVRVNDDLTFDFDDRNEVNPGHYAFLVDDATFDRTLQYVSNAGIDFGSGPGSGWNHQLNHLGGGRGVYIRDPDNHSYELFTAVP